MSHAGELQAWNNYMNSIKKQIVIHIQICMYSSKLDPPLISAKYKTTMRHATTQNLWLHNILAW
jgi:hypothetical protein